MKLSLRSSEPRHMDDLVATGSPEVFLAKVIHEIEGKMDDVDPNRAADDECNAGESIGPGRVYAFKLILLLDTSSILIL